MEVVTTLARNGDSDGVFFHGISGIICSVYNADVPWTYHLMRVLMKWQRQSFTDGPWVKSLIDSYIQTINDVETLLEKDTGCKVGL